MTVIPPSHPLLLALALLQGSPALEAIAPCEDTLRIELALAPTVAAREICVSPGMMTGFLFDTMPVFLELQDEVRFVEVLRGRSAISFVPPRDMVPGERLRLTARFGEGTTQESVTFALSAYPGQATRQVEVYRDKRTRESYQQEIEQERAKNHQLRLEIQRLHIQLERNQGLRSLIATDMVGRNGVQALELRPDNPEQSNGAVFFVKGHSYRTNTTVAVEVWLKNSSSEPWTTTGASLVGADGREMRGVKIRQEQPLLPDETGTVIVEVDALSEDARGHFELKLWDEKSRVVTIPGLRFP